MSNSSGRIALSIVRDSDELLFRWSADDLGCFEPLELELLALGDDGLQLDAQVGERRGVGGLLGHVPVEALLPVLEARELLLDASHGLAGLASLGRARRRGRPGRYAVGPA